MFCKMARAMKSRRGFTLVELMVVVVIIGVLVAIAVPVYNNTQTAAKQRADDASIRTLNGATQAWALDQSPPKELSTVTATDMTDNGASLVTAGYLRATITPQSTGKTKFVWDQTNMTWKAE